MNLMIAFVLFSSVSRGVPAIPVSPFLTADTVVVSSRDTIVRKRDVKEWVEAEKLNRESQRQLLKTNADLDKARKEIEDLKKQVSLQEATIQSFKVNEDTLNNRIARLNRERKAQGSVEKDKDKLEKDYGNLKKEYDDLEREYQQLKNKDYEKQVTLLRDEIKKYGQDIQTLKNQLKGSEEEMKVLREQLARLNSVRDRWFNQLVASAKADWLDKPFVGIDPASLQKAMAPYQEYASQSNDIRMADEQLKVLFKDYQTYQQTLKALNTPYDGEIVDQCYETARIACEKEKNAGRLKEWGDVMDKLKNYRARTWVCQQLVEAIDNGLKDKTRTRWNTVIDTIIQEEEENYATKTSIDSIPWLKEQFEGYVDRVKITGPSGENKYRAAIMGLNVR